MASVLRERGYSDIHFYDAAAADASLDGALKLARSLRPEVVGLSLYTVWVRKQYRFAARLKEELPQTTIVAGGPHATALPERTLAECRELDAVVIGEGELTFPEIIEALEAGKSLQEVRGLAIRRDGGVMKTPERELISDLDSLPFPALDLAWSNGQRYGRRGGEVGKRPGVIISSRGCPGRCTFCYRGTFGETYRQRSPGHVVNEMKWQTEKFGVDEIQFVDDLFLSNKKFVQGFLSELGREHVRLPWRCLTRVRNVGGALLTDLKAHGCYLVEFGVESGDDEVLNRIKKDITTEQVERAFRSARKAGLLTTGFFIIGHPGETRETARKTVDFARKLLPDFPSFSMLLPFPGSEVYSLVPEGIKYAWDRYNPYTDPSRPPISVCGLTPADIQELAFRAPYEVLGSVRYLVKNILFRRKIPFGTRVYLMRRWFGNARRLSRVKRRQPKSENPGVEWVRDTFQRKASRHESLQAFFAAELEAVMPFLRRIIDVTPVGSPVLESGCGTAFHSAFLSSLGYRAVVMDNDAEVVSYARENLRRLRAEVPLVRGDVFRLPFGDSTFRTIFHHGVLEHFSDGQIAAALKEAYRVANVVVFAVPVNGKGDPDARGDERWLSQSKWLELVKRTPWEVREVFHFTKRYALTRPFNALFRLPMIAGHLRYKAFMNLGFVLQRGSEGPRDV